MNALLPVRCLCGAEGVFPSALVDGVAPRPACAIALWTNACPSCAPGAAFYEWGWTLPGGRHVGLSGGAVTPPPPPVSLADARAARAMREAS